MDKNEMKKLLAHGEIPDEVIHLMKLMGCAECEDPDCPAAGLKIEVQRVNVEVGVTDLTQFPKHVLIIMKQGLADAINEIKEEIEMADGVFGFADLAQEIFGKKDQPEFLKEMRADLEGELKERKEMLPILEAELKRVEEAINPVPKASPEEVLAEMVKSISKTYGKPWNTELEDFQPRITEEQDGDGSYRHYVTVKMPQSNRGWAQKTWDWAKAFEKRFKGSWLSFKPDRPGDLIYIAVPAEVINDFAKLKNL